MFSGIGGVSYALRALYLDHVVVSFDLNHVANEVHRFNSPGKEILARNLTGMTAQELDQLEADVWTLCPPCQPFTR